MYLYDFDRALRIRIIKTMMLSGVLSFASSAVLGIIVRCMN